MENVMKRRKTNSTSQCDPSIEGRELFKWLISPCSIEEFYKTYWEKEPLIIHRKNGDYYKDRFFTLNDLYKELETNNNLEYGKNIDITNYKNEQRETLNEQLGSKHVAADDIRQRFKEACTIRVLHPQEFSQNLYEVRK